MNGLSMNSESSRGCMRDCRRTSMRQQCVPEGFWSTRLILRMDGLTDCLGDIPFETSRFDRMKADETKPVV